MIHYQRQKRNADRTTRCYLTLDCNGGCSYCSAGVPGASQAVRDQTIAPEIWAEGINRRNRECILAGGEPFMYPHFPELANMVKVRAQIYTNLKCDVTRFLDVCKKTFAILVSCHPMTADEDILWIKNVRAMKAAGHALRFHVVKHDGWKERLDFIRDNGIEGKITVCDDQRIGTKSSGAKLEILPVVCRSRIYLWGPDGYRYPCVTMMVNGARGHRAEHISEGDSDDWLTVENCMRFGNCVGCDNNIEGEVTTNRGNE